MKRFTFQAKRNGGFEARKALSSEIEDIFETNDPLQRHQRSKFSSERKATGNSGIQECALTESISSAVTGPLQHRCCWCDRERGRIARFHAMILLSPDTIYVGFVCYPAVVSVEHSRSTQYSFLLRSKSHPTTTTFTGTRYEKHFEFPNPLIFLNQFFPGPW